MSREIKFKAWFKGNETQKPAFIMGFNMVNFHSHFNAGCEPHIYRYDTKWKLSEIELLQYTGLKDKYGKDIYEGDLVIVHYDEDDFLCEIICDLIQGLRYKRIAKVYFRGENNQSFKKIDDAFYYKNAYEIKVIGNIYQNPDLLQ